MSPRHVPKVSVVMPVYNTERYLRPAVESILGQTLTDVELILVDDGSTDGSRAILQSFHDPRIRVILNATRQGGPAARNQGLGLACADYVAALDADDVAHRDRLVVQSSFLDEHPDVCLVGGAYEIIDELGRAQGIQRVPTDAWTIRWKLLFGNTFGHSTVMFRRRAVLAVGAYDPALPFAEDYDLWVRLAPHHQLVQQEQPLTSYRVHGESTTQQTADTTKERAILGIVGKAIGQLLGRTIDPNVVRILARDVPGQGAAGSDLTVACKIVQKCLPYLIAGADVPAAERHRLVAAAQAELLGIADRYPGAKDLCDRAALCLMARHDPLRLVTPRGLRTAARALLPKKARHVVRRVRPAAAHRDGPVTGGSAMPESPRHPRPNPLVSVIVPCYNQARFLPEAVRSVQDQTYPHWECLIINDGSTDATAAVGAALAATDRRVRLLSQPNRGLAGARNRGLAEARGQFIQFLDADDAIRPPKFQTQLSDLAHAAGPALSYCDFCMAPEEDLHAPRADTYADGRFRTGNPLVELAARWETQLSIPCHCFLFDARFFAERGIRFDEALPNHEDWDCWMRIFALKPAVHYVDAKLAVYRFRAQSMCRDRGAMRRGYLAALAKQQRLFARDREMTATLRRKRRETKQVYRDYGPRYERWWIEACLRGRHVLGRTAKAVLPQLGAKAARSGAPPGPAGGG